MIIDKNTFCIWDASSIENTSLIIFNVFITFILLGFMVRNYIRSAQKNINIFYYLLFGWAFAFLLKDLFSIVVFFSDYVNHVGQENSNWQKNNNQLITKYSTIYLILDTLPPTILQTLIFMIPYHMIENVMNIIRMYGYLVSKRQVLWYRLFTFYQYLRIVIVIPLIVLFCLFSDFKNGQGEYQYKVKSLQYTSYSIVILICIDCLICNAVQYYTYKYLKKKYEVLKINNQEDQKKFKRQCILLSIAVAGRLLIDFVFYVVLPISFSTSDDQLCLPQAKNNIQYTICYIVIGVPLMHFFPIITILKMYYKPT